MVLQTLHLDSPLFYWSGAQEIVFFFLCDLTMPFWKHQDWFPAILPVISESENRIYFAVNFGGNSQSQAFIKTGTHQKMSVLRICSFVCILLRCRLVLIEFLAHLSYAQDELL